jgi:hypothetical protein
MNLYVCYTTSELHIRPGGHPCANAIKALEAAGHHPDIVKTHSFGALPAAVQTKGRKHVKEQTGTHWVPALETGDGEWIGGSKEIVAWARKHPAGASAATAAV